MFGKKKKSPQPLSAAERFTLHGFQALDQGDAEKAISFFRAGLEIAPLDRTLREGLHEALSCKSSKQNAAPRKQVHQSATLNVAPPAPLQKRPVVKLQSNPKQPIAQPKQPTKREQQQTQALHETRERSAMNPGFASSDFDDELPPRKQKPTSDSRWKIPFLSTEEDEFSTHANAELDAAMGTFAEEFKPQPERRRYAHGAPNRTPFSRSLPWVVAILVGAGFLTVTAFAKQGLDYFLTEVALPKISQQEVQMSSLPEELNTLLIEASENLTNRKSADAVKALTSAWDVFPKHQDAIRPVLVSSLRVQGTELMNASQYEDALKLFEKTTQLEPEDENNWIEYGRSLREYGRRIQQSNFTRSQVLYERSTAAYAKAIEIDQNNTSALFGLGQVYVLLQKREEAVSKYKRVVALAPGSPEARKAQEFLEQMIGSKS